MKYQNLILACFAVSILLLNACVAKNPAHPVIIAEVKDGLNAEFSQELTSIENMIIFENTLKVYMAPDWPNDKLDALARRTTELFGPSMRKNKIRNVMYFVNFYQDKEVQGEKKKNKQIAECMFESQTDRIKVELLGLGEGKYDYK
jgi:hypothetical protein